MTLSAGWCTAGPGRKPWPGSHARSLRSVTGRSQERNMACRAPMKH